jgi:hypothetical protein
MRMRSITRKRRQKRKTKKRVGGGFMEYPSFYIKNVLSMFTLSAPSGHGNKTNVKPFPYFQPK